MRGYSEQLHGQHWFMMQRNNEKSRKEPGGERDEDAEVDVWSREKR